MSLDIKIDKSGAVISVTKENVKHCKNVDFSELMAVMQSHAVHDFGLLPSNTRYLSVAGTSYTVAVEVPPRTPDLSVVSTVDGKVKVVPKVPLPAALAIFQLVARDGGFYHSVSYLFALAGDRLIFSTDKLHAYPLPNIYKEDQKICWGANDMKVKLKSLAGIEGLLQTYFSAPFNFDLFDTSRMDKQKFPWNKIPFRDGFYNIESYFKFLSENGFNKEWLQPLTGDYEDFSKAIKKLGR